MIVFDQERLSEFFRTVSSGFAATRLDVIIVIAAGSAFVLFLVAFYLVQHGRARRGGKTLAAQRYRELKERFGLTPEEDRLVGQLARFLKQPYKRHVILESQPAFNHCAQKLRDKGVLPSDGLANLRLKLGFTARNPEAVPASSTEIPVGTAVLIRKRNSGSRQKQRTLRGRVLHQEPQSLAVRLMGEDTDLHPGDPVGVVFQNRAGLFSFAGRVVSREGNLLRFSHAESIRRVQRRKFYRRKTSLPTGIRLSGSEGPFLPAAFIDLGGDGASLTNPQRRFNPGDAVELSFQNGGERFTVQAEVLRLSRGGERLHVRFAPLREADRDRLIGSLFRAV